MGKCDHARPRRDGPRNSFYKEFIAGMRIGLIDDGDRVTKPPGFLLPRSVVARMIIGKDDYFVARLQVEPARDDVVSLAGVARENNLLRFHPEEFGRFLPRVFLAHAHLHAVVEGWIAVHVFRASV